MAAWDVVRTAFAGWIVLATMAAASSGSGVIYVDADGPLDGDGSAWDTAFPCLQNALALARQGDVIRVAQGTYRPDRIVARVRRIELRVSGDRTATFELVGGATIQGGYAGLGEPDPNARDIELYPTVLSGDLKDNDVELLGLAWQAVDDFTSHASRNDNSYAVVTATGGDAGAILDGCTITGGHWAGPNPAGLAVGGSGLHANRSSCTLVHCTFRRNTMRVEVVPNYGWGIRGGAVANVSSTPSFHDCRFVENICFTGSGSGLGGAVYNDESHSRYVDCLFERNVASGSDKDSGGAAICNHRSNPTFTNCRFVGNLALRSRGGCLYNFVNSNPVLTGCTFVENASEYGGAIYNLASSPTLTDCTFVRNASLQSGPGGAIVNDAEARPTLTRCVFLGNSAYGGGAIQNGWNSKPMLLNCVFSGNTASIGGAIYNANASPEITNCTFSRNVAGDKGGAIYNFGSQWVLSNCIFLGDVPEAIRVEIGQVVGRYSDVEGGWPGESNIDGDPLFVDADGPDDMAGTEDDDLRLLAGSPCIDAGINTAVPASLLLDLAGNARIANGTVDMGAYEGGVGPSQIVYHVDTTRGEDSGDGLSPATAFATIQKGIDAAQDGCIVLVHPGVYEEEIDFKGKAVTLTSAGDAAVIEAPGHDAVSFYRGEGPDSVLRNFVIRNSGRAVFIVGSSPTISQLTLVDNDYGVAAFLTAAPDISNCIFWRIRQADMVQCRARYSRTRDAGEGNFDADPLFADPDNGDFHLRSQRGRYRPSTDEWILDRVTSPCVDAGDPARATSGERMPHGGRINIGAYGGTSSASMSEWPLRADLDYDGVVDIRDLAIMADAWLQTMPWTR